MISYVTRDGRYRPLAAYRAIFRTRRADMATTPTISLLLTRYYIFMRSRGTICRSDRHRAATMGAGLLLISAISRTKCSRNAMTMCHIDATDFAAHSQKASISLAPKAADAIYWRVHMSARAGRNTRVRFHASLIELQKACQNTINGHDDRSQVFRCRHRFSPPIRHSNVPADSPPLLHSRQPLLYSLISDARLKNISIVAKKLIIESIGGFHYHASTTFHDIAADIAADFLSRADIAIARYFFHYFIFSPIYFSPRAFDYWPHARTQLFLASRCRHRLPQRHYARPRHELGFISTRHGHCRARRFTRPRQLTRYFKIFVSQQASSIQRHFLALSIAQHGAVPAGHTRQLGIPLEVSFRCFRASAY